MADFWMLYPQGKLKALTLSYDDGVEQDIRLIEIMNRHGLKGTFNLNSGQFAPEGTTYPAGHIHRRMTEKAVLELYGGSGHEVAIHALYHGDLPNIPAAHAIWQVMRDKEKLENLGCEEVEIVGHDGTKLVGHWHRCDNAERVIIAMHGWRSSWSSDFGAISSFWHKKIRPIGRIFYISAPISSNSSLRSFKICSTW